MIEASRSILNRYIPDIYLYSDVYKGDESGKWEVFRPSTFLRILMTMQHLQIAWVCPDTPRRVNYVWNTLCRGYFRSRSCTRRHWAQGYASPSGRNWKGRMCWPEASNPGVAYDGSRERGCWSMSYGWTDTQDVCSLLLYSHYLLIFCIGFNFWETFERSLAHHSKLLLPNLRIRIVRSFCTLAMVLDTSMQIGQ